ncbi:SMP-30/gluconolactonase/LRE family protein [Elstera litoralis]|uniref:SMP-30/gluconolactonase/LRE family protein n=1 Tax=Elstera litoralis TaxID=552518 RepID=UPI00069884B5|nr:SMP-30/gluconolactonase/LRE family protein [Elstera litoralis]
MTDPVLTQLTETPCKLGEGPVWHEGALWWVDIKQPSLHRLAGGLKGGAYQRFALPEPVGAAVPTTAGDWLVGLKSGVYRFTPETGALAAFATLEPDMPGNRLNDGKVDPHGRFWIGSMDDAENDATGQFYCLSGTPPRIAELPVQFTVTNGLGWSGDGSRMYLTDSANRTIFCAPYDPATGTVGERRVFAQLTEDEGYPDGLCIDADDHVWSCHWDGARLTRYRPDGSRERVIPLPFNRPTSCCFGGAALDTLYVTSAQDKTGQGGFVWAVNGLKQPNNLTYASLYGVKSTLFVG